MKTSASEILDLVLTQSIDRYADMEPSEAYKAIASEWPEQIAVLLAVFYTRLCVGTNGETPNLVYRQRRNRYSNYISFPVNLPPWW